MGKPGLRPNTHCCSNMTSNMAATAENSPWTSTAQHMQTTLLFRRKTIHRKREQNVRPPGRQFIMSSLITQLRNLPSDQGFCNAHYLAPKGAFLALICCTWLGDGTLGPSFLHELPLPPGSCLRLLPPPTSLHNPGPSQAPMDNDLRAPEDLGTAPRCPSPGSLDRPRPQHPDSPL